MQTKKLWSQKYPLLFQIETDAGLALLLPCSNDEADPWMILPIEQAAMYHKIRTVDTDVVVLAVSAVVNHEPAHQIATSLGPFKSKCLPMFHGLSGCDTVSSFNNIGKKKAWQVWEVYEDTTPCFVCLSSSPSHFTHLDMAVIERCVVLLYDRTSNELDVNGARVCLSVHQEIPPD